MSGQEKCGLCRERPTAWIYTHRGEDFPVCEPGYQVMHEKWTRERFAEQLASWFKNDPESERERLTARWLEVFDAARSGGATARPV